MVWEEEVVVGDGRGWQRRKASVHFCRKSGGHDQTEGGGGGGGGGIGRGGGGGGDGGGGVDGGFAPLT